MDVLEAIMTRRSVRRFTGEPVTDEQMEVLLRAAMQAPSASNRRPWRFVVVTNKETLDRLSRATPFAGALAGAAAGLVVCADRGAARYPGFWIIDCAAAIQNLLLAAHGSGLGGVWIGVHPIRPFGWAVRRAVGLPRGIVAHSMVAIGHPADVPAAVERYDPSLTHAERWSVRGNDL